MGERLPSQTARLQPVLRRPRATGRKMAPPAWQQVTQRSWQPVLGLAELGQRAERRAQKLARAAQLQSLAHCDG